jgi:hypothetical protein
MRCSFTQYESIQRERENDMTKAQLTDAELDSPAKSCRQVTKALRAAGHAETLVRNTDYFYFSEGDAESWHTSSVCVYRISSMTVREWLEARDELAAEHVLFTQTFESRKGAIKL